MAESSGRQISELSIPELQGLSDKFGDDVKEVFDFEKSVERRDAIGGTSFKMVERQVQVLRKAVAS